jgi:hypothetical protein
MTCCSCDFCEGVKSVSLINQCHHNICEDCIAKKKLKIGDQCPFIFKIEGIGNVVCGKIILGFKTI